MFVDAKWENGVLAFGENSVIGKREGCLQTSWGHKLSRRALRIFRG